MVRTCSSIAWPALAFVHCRFLQNLQVLGQFCLRLCRFRRVLRELLNEYLLAKIGLDAAESGTGKVCPLSAYRLLLLQIPQVNERGVVVGHDDDFYRVRLSRGGEVARPRSGLAALLAPADFL